MIETACQECGRVFERRKREKRGGRKKQRKFCSVTCANRSPLTREARRRKLALVYETHCIGCGKVFKPKRSRHSRYCSRKCFALNQRTIERRCVSCGALFAGPHNKRYCTSSCRPSRQRKSPIAIHCAECGSKFMSKWENKKYCSKKCQTRRISRNRAARNGREFSLRVCPMCGREFTRFYGEKRRKYCDSRCCLKASKNYKWLSGYGGELLPIELARTVAELRRLRIVYYDWVTNQNQRKVQK